MKILGLSFYYHDAAAALIVDGVPVAMSEEERFSRRKHDSEYPELAVEFVLKQAGIEAKDLDYAVFYEKPFLKFERIMKVNLAAWPRAPHVFSSSLRESFLKKLWVRDLIARRLGIPAKKVLFSEHHFSHAASAFYPSPFDEAAVLTVDGVGEWAVTTLGKGKGRELEILKEIHFPHSLGLLYSAFTAFLGFEVNEGEYKVMGMAPYGTPKYADQVRRMITLFQDGSYALDMTYFTFQRSLSRTYSDRFIELFGAPRDPKSKFFTRATGWPSYFGGKPQGAEYDRLAEEQERYADIAASLQLVLEDALVHVANSLHKLVGGDTLVFAGGVALNCVANWKLAERTPFKKVFVQPAAGDGGAALGAALAVHHAALGNPRAWRMQHAYYGAGYTNEQVAAFLKEKNIAAKHVPNEDELVRTVAQAIADGKVIGWFNGRFEWGPRALGARSILADARREEMKDIVNTKIKFREPYRPFAPSVLAEQAEEIFELPNAMQQDPARYMLYVVQVKKDQQKVVPAITHVDGSARPQLVMKEHSPRYHKLISEFHALTGVPLVMNTSFNLKGEPIVNTPADAYSTFMRSGIDLLVLENYIIEKDKDHG